METKLAKFRETQSAVGKLFAEKVTRESLDQVQGSVAEMESAHNKLQDVYIQWYDKTNKIIEECKEQKQRATTSGSGMSHKCPKIFDEVAELERRNAVNTTQNVKTKRVFTPFCKGLGLFCNGFWGCGDLGPHKCN